MTLRATEKSSQTRAKACMDVIREGLKDQKLNPRELVTRLDAGDLKFGVARLSAAVYCMDVLKDGLKEHNLKPSDLANEYGVSISEFKEWLGDATLPFDVLLDICHKQHLKVNDLFQQAMSRINEDRDAGNLKQAPVPETPDVPTMRDWFKGDMPFVWFIGVSGCAKIKAIDVFDRAKELIKSSKKNNDDPSKVEAPFDRTYIKEDDQSPKVGVDPWVQLEEQNTDGSTVTDTTSTAEPHGKPRSHDASDADDEDSASNVTSAESQKGSRSTTVESDPLSAWDDETPEESTPSSHVEDAGKANKGDDRETPDSNSETSHDTETESQVDDSSGDGGAKVEKEVISGVTEVDMSTPTAIPYHINLSGKDTGMHDVDTAILSWPTLRMKALDSRDDLTEEKRAKLEAKYPAPIKVNNEILGLKFPDDDSFRAFVDKGYMRELQDVINKEGLTVVLQQSNFKNEM